jgi:sugar lactone lactonase YvrE
MKRVLCVVMVIAAVLAVLCAGGVVYMKWSSPHLLRFSKGIDERTVTVKLAELPGAVFIKGMGGCENLYLDDASERVYVTDLHGTVHLLDGESWQTLKIAGAKKLGAFALGIAKGPDKRLYVNVSGGTAEDWLKTGGAVWRIGTDLSGPEKMTGPYPGLNGLSFDGEGNLYFAAGNASIMHPDGHVYRMKIGPDGVFAPPEVFLAHVGWANGLYFSAKENRFFFSNTVEGCFTFAPGMPKAEPVYYKTKIAEAVDDLCTDQAGRLWMTDPGTSTVKVFDPRTRRLVRYRIEGIGQTSSCRIRREREEEVLYVTELKQSQKLSSQVFDGRGLLAVPVKSLVR